MDAKHSHNAAQSVGKQDWNFDENELNRISKEVRMSNEGVEKKIVTSCVSKALCKPMTEML